MKSLAALAFIVTLLSVTYVYAQGLGLSMSFHDIIVLSRGGGTGSAPPASNCLLVDVGNCLLVDVGNKLLVQ